jgi:membrane protein implicated in regulation of membrane protease activity
VGGVAVIYLLHFSAEALIFLFVACAAASIPLLVRHIGRLQDDQIQRDRRRRDRLVGEIQRNHPLED